MENNIVCCIKLKTLSLSIGIVFFLFQALILVGFFFSMTKIDDYSNTILDWLASQANDTKDLQSETHFLYLKSIISRRASDYYAIPVTITIILMLSNSLLIWSTHAKQKILLWPWLVLHALELICFLCIMTYMIFILPQNYLKILSFLVVCPFLITFAFCWYIIRSFYNYLHELYSKEVVASIYIDQDQVTQTYVTIPATVYSTGSQPHWDHPLPVWSSSNTNNGIFTTGMDHRYPNFPTSLNKGGGVVKTMGKRRNSLMPKLLPDGTLVIPMADESCEDLTEIEEENEDDISQRSDTKNGVHKQQSEDGRMSIRTLSDKYRQQEEIEVFEEFYALSPPKPILSNDIENQKNKSKSLPIIL